MKHLRPEPKRPILHAEALEAAMQELLAAADDAIERRGSAAVSTHAPMDDWVVADLRQAIEQEFQPAVSSPHVEIEPHELERELIKSALANLRSPTLKSIANSLGLPVTGNKDILTNRIGRDLGWDADRVARLVARAENADLQPPAHLSRMFALRDVPDLASVQQRLQYVENRYVKVGLAKWFGFGGPTQTAEELHISGAYRSYQAQIETKSNEPSLKSSNQTVNMSITFPSYRSAMLVGNVGITPARTAARATAKAAAVDLLGFVPNVYLNASPLRQELHPTTTFILDFIYNRLKAVPELEGTPNVTVARFKMANVEEHSWQDADAENATGPRTRQPKLHGVKLDGRYLLDSPAACNLMAIEQRPLLDVSMDLRCRQPGSNYADLHQVKISVETDHIAVSTSQSVDQQGSQFIHDRVTAAMLDQIQYGLADEPRMNALTVQIRAQAALHDGDDSPAFLD
ncbi:SAP domain-containing protein [Nocardioides sp. S-58]|uniref:SAP domain-containing protein n=1 Tax=Nocardioides renjunii TaxID=3095075 RepID=A0ABU5K8X1_9ACTN|nr:SAP domain-containing protein [Nocardioides sp. S-58]MDZ5661409.1 SAP domain-containing protein [Nocardioides sp. S-58]